MNITGRPLDNLIEGFFEYELNETELQQFQEKLKTDPQFQEQVKLYEMARNTAMQAIDPQQEIRKKEQSAAWKAIAREEGHPKLTIRRRIFRSAAMAASILFMAGVLLFLFQQKDAMPDAVQLAEARVGSIINLGELKMQSGNTLNRSVTDQPNQKYAALVTAYENENWMAVLQLTNQLDEKTDASYDVFLLRGIALRKEHRYKEAHTIMNQLLTSEEGQREVFLWEMVLINLESKPPNSQRAGEFLEILIDKYPSSKDHAINLLKIINGE